MTIYKLIHLLALMTYRGRELYSGRGRSGELTKEMRGPSVKTVLSRIFGFKLDNPDDLVLERCKDYGKTREIEGEEVSSIVEQ